MGTCFACYLDRDKPSIAYVNNIEKLEEYFKNLQPYVEENKFNVSSAFTTPYKLYEILPRSILEQLPFSLNKEMSLQEFIWFYLPQQLEKHFQNYPDNQKIAKSLSSNNYEMIADSVYRDIAISILESPPGSEEAIIRLRKKMTIRRGRGMPPIDMNTDNEIEINILNIKFCQLVLKGIERFNFNRSFNNAFLRIKL
jgi:hypothetical protein